jgi:SAM-dependent methyltransferase
MGTEMFRTLQRIHDRPAAFAHNTATELWTDEHISSRMLAHHLDGASDISSRRTTFIDRSAAWMSARFDLGPGKKVLDLGCGPGLYTTRLARSGAAVTGIDVSERSIRYARGLTESLGLSVEYLCGSYLDLRPHACFDLAIMITCDFCALSPEQRGRLCRMVRACLEPDGAFVFDVYSLSEFERRSERSMYAVNLLDGFWSPRPYFGFLNTFKYEAERAVLDRYTIVEAERTREFHNWLQYYDPESLTRELADSSLHPAELLGNVAGDRYDPAAPEFAAVAHPASR